MTIGGQGGLGATGVRALNRGLVVTTLVGALLASLTAPALANLSRKDPNDFRYRPDIQRSASQKFRGDYLGVPQTLLIRMTVEFYDRIGWAKDPGIMVRLDTRGGNRADYSITWLKEPFLTGGFGCWLSEGASFFIPGDIVLDEDEVADSGRGPRAVTCTVPRLAMVVNKPVKWDVVVLTGNGSAPLADAFDFAPNRGWYPHL
jgi:hypothetical protein